MSFQELALHPKLMKAVEACGFEEPTPIQAQAIPIVREGRDLMASAQTGTGKTAAFVLPLLERLMKRSKIEGKGPRTLILTPTRELALQVDKNITDFTKFAKFHTGNIIGGAKYEAQYRLLDKPLDMLVATPGRLIDHVQQGRVDFSRLEVFVLDEADRMLDLGFIDDIRRIARKLPKKKQTLLFSATLEGSVLTIANELLVDPAEVKLAANRVQHAQIEQRIHHADDLLHKHRLLMSYLDDESLTQAIIFTSTRKNADRLSQMISAQGQKAHALHGDMSQSERKRTMDKMKDGNVRLLVATDVAARGLDIKGVSHVINFDLPSVAEDYIHRIGRTGRAGAEGIAISIVGSWDWGKMADIQKLTGNKIEPTEIKGLEPKTPVPRFLTSETTSNKPRTSALRPTSMSAKGPRRSRLGFQRRVRMGGR